MRGCRRRPRPRNGGAGGREGARGEPERRVAHLDANRARSGWGWPAAAKGSSAASVGCGAVEDAGDDWSVPGSIPGTRRERRKWGSWRRRRLLPGSSRCGEIDGGGGGIAEGTRRWRKARVRAHSRRGERKPVEGQVGVLVRTLTTEIGGSTAWRRPTWRHGASAPWPPWRGEREKRIAERPLELLN